jgi:hypothetical protein
MIEVRQTVVFEEWLSRLRDQRAVDRIIQRIARLETGLFGDVKPVGQGVSGWIAKRFNRIKRSARGDQLWTGLSALFRSARAGADRSAVWWRQANPAAGYRKGARVGK